VLVDRRECGDSNSGLVCSLHLIPLGAVLKLD
jgi:hypothetical protein